MIATLAAQLEQSVKVAQEAKLVTQAGVSLIQGQLGHQRCLRQQVPKQVLKVSSFSLSI